MSPLCGYLATIAPACVPPDEENLLGIFSPHRVQHRSEFSVDVWKYFQSSALEFQ